MQSNYKIALDNYYTRRGKKISKAHYILKVICTVVLAVALLYSTFRIFTYDEPFEGLVIYNDKLMYVAFFLMKERWWIPFLAIIGEFISFNHKNSKMHVETWLILAVVLFTIISIVAYLYLRPYTFVKFFFEGAMNF